MQPPPIYECAAADEATREAVEASAAANVENPNGGKRDAHLAASAKQKKAALANREAAKVLRARMMPNEASEYESLADHHDTVGNVHEEVASLYAAKDGTATARGAKPGERYSFIAKAAAQGVPQLSELTAKAKVFGEANGGLTGLAATDAFLLSQEGREWYARYRDGILSGQSGFPQKVVAK